MTIFQTIILGIVEGITEFLPISSTAHLMLTAKLLNIASSDFLKSFEIIIQLGAIAAVVYQFGPRLAKNFVLVKKVSLAFIPTAIIGFILYSFIKEFLLGNLTIAVWSLIVGGIVLVVVERVYVKKIKANESTAEDISYKQAFCIGVIQSLAVVPGVSRAAATIVPALLFGKSRKAAAEFSFLLAIPTVAAAALYDLLKNFNSLSGNLLNLSIGFIVSGIAALITIRFLLSYIQNHTFTPFGIYRIVIAVLFLTFIL